MPRYTWRALVLPALLWVPSVLLLAHEPEPPPSGERLHFYGSVQLDLIQDFRRVHPDFADTLRPTRIPTTQGLYGADGEFIASVRQSRFGVEGTLGELRAVLEFDLFGVGSDAGKTTPNLSRAYGEYRQWKAGLTDTLFMDWDVFPNIVDYWGPSGMALVHNLQLRWTPFDGPNSFAVALEHTASAIDTGRFGREFPEFGDNAQGRDELPDLTARFHMTRDWGHLQVAGLLRKVAFETAGTPDNRPRGEDTGWGVALTGSLALGAQGRLLFSALGGEGIASYVSDGGTDLIPGDSAPEELPEPTAMPLWAAMLYYERQWSPDWSSAIGYSFTAVDNSNNQDGDAFRKGEYASVNLLNTAIPNLRVGAELLWGRRTDHDGATGEDIRFQLSIRYRFPDMRKQE